MAPEDSSSNPFKDLPAKEFKRAVNVPHLETQHQPYQPIPGPGIELPDPGVLSVETKSNDPVIARKQGDQKSKLGDIELTVSIREKEVFLGAGLDSASNGCPIALIFFMVNGTNPSDPL